MKKNIWSDWLKAAVVLAVFFLVYRSIQSAGWLGNLSVNTRSATLGISLLVGFVASLSSCLAVVGSIVIAFASSYAEASEDKKKNYASDVLRPNLFFHIGRVATFFVLGGLLGLVGGTINLSGSFVSIYTIVIAVVMGWLGLSILGILPSISALVFRPPGFFVRFWARIEESNHKTAPFLLGGITFFLPCGFTQSMQILALASGSFWRGAAILSVFSLGTLPVLFLLGMSASWGKRKNLGFLQKAAGIIVVVFAVFTLQSGLALKGVKTNVVGPDNDKKVENQNQAAGETQQIVAMDVASSGFEPSVLSIKQGIPVKWMINGVNVTGCTSTIIVPSYNISKKLKSGENIIQFTPRSKGVINFSCGMGMVRGKFIVE